MTDQGKEIRFAGRRCVTMDPSRYPQAAQKANAYATSIGPHSGLGYVVMLRRDLADLDPAGAFDLTFTVSDDGNASTVTFKDLVIDVATKIGGGADNYDEAAYLVRLVDKRWHLTRWTTAFRRFNVRSWAGGEPNYFDEKWIRETIAAPLTPWKNSEIISQLWGDLGFAGPLPAFPVNALGRPRIDDIAPIENLHFNGVSAWTAIHDVLHQVGYTTAINHEKGVFEFVELGADQNLAFTNDRVIYNADRYSGGTTYAPERITVAFPTRYDDYGSERDTEPSGNWCSTWAAYAVTLPTGAQNAIAGTHLTLWDPTSAVRRHGSWAIDNAGDLMNRAVAIISGYLQNNAQGVPSSGDRAHTLYQGLQPAARCGPQIKALIVRDYGRDATRGVGDGLVTELMRHPGWPEPAEHFAAGGERLMSGLGFGFSDRSVIEHRDGLDLQRPTWPSYPRLPNLIKLTKYEISSECCVSTEEVSEGEEDPGDAKPWALVWDPVKKLFGGVLHRYDAASGFTALEEVWLYFPNYDSGKFKIEPDAFYFARLSGQETSARDGRKLPLYVASSHIRALPSWSNECLSLPDSGVEFEHGKGACDVKTLAVDASTSLALYRREPADDKCRPSVGIAIKGSPYPCSVFWTGPDSKVPKWTVSPRMKTAQFRSGIELGGACGEASESDSPSTWLLPGAQAQKIKTPSNSPTAPAALLAKTSGDCVETEWGPEGLTAEHNFVDNVVINYAGGTVWMYGDCDCYIYQSPLVITLDVTKCPVKSDRGIVVQICDETPDGSGGGSGDCGNVMHCKPLDPCNPPADGDACCSSTSTEEEEVPGLLPPIDTEDQIDTL